MNNQDTFLKEVVRPTLLAIDLYSEEAVQLVLATAMIEQHLLSREDKIASVFNISRSMHDDLWINFLEFRPDIVSSMCKLVSQDLSKIALDEKFYLLKHSEFYSTAVCRLIYYRVPKTIPMVSNKEALALYWLTYFHSDKDAFANDLVLINNFKSLIVSLALSKSL